MIDASFAMAGALTGFAVGLTGVGGGVLMTPILLIFFGVEPVTAVATDLWFAAFTKLVGARVHQMSGKVDWQVARRLWIGSLPMALLTVVLMHLGSPVVRVQWLTTAIGVLVLATALGLLLAPRLLPRVQILLRGPRQEETRWQVMLTVVCGGILGLCVAMTSIGAGVLGSVMLLYLYPCRMTPHCLVATDIVHAIPLAAVAGLGHLVTGMVDWGILASLLVGSLPAVVLASLLAERLSGRRIQIVLAVVLMAAGVKVLT
jgi:hypothetical protein